MIATEALSKKFGAIAAVDHVSLNVEEGELFGIIGPDGAGKTTLFRLLTTLLLPDGGGAKVGGRDIVRDYAEIRRIVGYMPGRFSLYPDLSVEENLRFFATLFGVKVAENYDLIRDIYVQLEPFRDRRAAKLSGGMKQKLALCCALVHRPRILFLDEPTTGVDPVSRREFWNTLDLLRQQGITTVVSTPYMDEAGRCDRIALMQQGRILAVDSPDQISEKYPLPLYAIRGPRIPALLFLLREYENTAECASFGDVLHLSFVDNHEGAITSMKEFLDAHGYSDVSIERITPGIEDSFMYLIKETHDET